MAVDVENTVGITDTQSIELNAPNLGSDSRDVNLNGGDSTAETFSLSTGDDDTSEHAATVKSEDDSAQQEATVLVLAAFSIDITDTNNPVAGDPLEIIVTIENTGDETGTWIV